MFNDLRYAFRMLSKNPGFSAVVVLTLALGIGGTTAIFSVIYGAVLNPWPYADSDRIAVLVARDSKNPGSGRWAWVSPAEFIDYREQNHVFDQVFGGHFERVLLTGRDAPANWLGLWMTPNTFQVLGISPLIGRTMIDDDARPGAPPVVVLNHKVWQQEFGGDPGIVGRTLILNRQPTTVVGVMPPRFKHFGGLGGPDCWLPVAFSKSETGDNSKFTPVFGHLKPEAKIENASAELEVIAKRLATVYPKSNPRGLTFSVRSLTESRINKKSRATINLLMGGVSLLLLIACVNVANLLMARATGREKEFAVRATLGAGRGRLVYQLLIESLLLALAGSALGTFLVWEVLDIVAAIIPSWFMPDEAIFRINGWVLLFTLGVTLVSTLVFGLVPALLAVSNDLQTPLKANGRGAGTSCRHSRLRGLLVVSEVTLSLVLLVGAGLPIRSFIALEYATLGYTLDNVLSIYTDPGLPEERYKTPEQRNQFCIQSLRRVRALPGVVSAALSWPSINYAVPASFELAGKLSGVNQSAWLRGSSDQFFETMGIRLFQGRTISEEDCLLKQKVAVVNRAFVGKYLQGENPLGQQIKMTGPVAKEMEPEQQPYEIVGVVADTRHSQNLEPSVQPTIFIPYVNEPGLGLVIRTAADPTTMVNSIRHEIATLDRELPVEWYISRDILRWWYIEPRFVTSMLGSFAALGVMLVCIGVYSVLSYAVSQCTHEIGVRMALGAEATDVRRMVMMSGLRWLLVGIGIGIPASIALSKILQNRIWGIKSADPLTLVAVSLLLTAVGLAACYFPARRATRVDPMVALRCE